MAYCPFADEKTVPDEIVGHRFAFHGAPGWIRTNDTRFRRAVLYPLSYEGA